MALPKPTEYLILSALLFSFISLGGSYAVWSGLAQDFTSVRSPALPAGRRASNTLAVPNLGRGINITADIPSESHLKFASKITEISGILKENPELADYWVELGSLRQFIGDYEGAAEAWEYASAIRPEAHVPLNNLGFLYRYQLKDYPKAEENFLLATAVRPDFMAAYRELSDLYRYAWEEKRDMADDILLKGLEKNPGNYDLLVYLAGYYRDTGETELAVKYFKEALRADPAAEGIVEELRRLESR